MDETKVTTVVIHYIGGMIVVYGSNAVKDAKKIKKILSSVTIDSSPTDEQINELINLISETVDNMEYGPHCNDETRKIINDWLVSVALQNQPKAVK